MKAKSIVMGILLLFGVVTLLGSCKIIDTGEVGVKTTFGQIDQDEVAPGFTLKAPFITSLRSYNVKESTIELRDLTPKAGDNLSLKDMDVSIYYEVNGAQVAELLSEFSGQTLYDEEEGVWMPGKGIAIRLAREAVYDTISQMDSLTIHKKRELIAANIKKRLQNKLNGAAADSFTITNVVVRAITTDQSIEASIQKAVQAQKALEQKQVEVEIAEADAEIKIAEARGIAESNRIIDSSLTRAYLKHEENLALMEMAKKGANTIVVPAGGATPLINVGK